MAEPTLDACREKHRRGVKHLDDLNGRVSKYLATEPKPHRVSGKFHPDRREYVVVGEITEPMDEVAWGVLFGDVLHNFRSALDHLVWQLVLLHTRKEGDGGNCFPMESSGRRYWSIEKDGSPSVRDRALKGVSGEHKAIIDALQPYRTRDEGAPFLADLRAWSNYDKHRLLNPVLAAVDAVSPNGLMPLPNEDAGILVGHQTSPFSPDGEAEILALEYSCPGPNPNVTVDREIPINVGFGKPPVRVGDLPKLADYVGAIIEKFAPSF